MLVFMKCPLFDHSVTEITKFCKKDISNRPQKYEMIFCLVLNIKNSIEFDLRKLYIYLNLNKKFQYHFLYK